MLRAHPRTLLAFAAVSFIGVTLLRLVVGGGAEAVSVLYVLPIAALALRDGAVGGVIGFAIATWLAAGTSYLDEPAFSVLGVIDRVVAFLLVGYLVGYLVDRQRKLERIAANARQRAADAERRCAELEASLPQPVPDDAQR